MKNEFLLKNHEISRFDFICVFIKLCLREANAIESKFYSTYLKILIRIKFIQYFMWNFIFNFISNCKNMKLNIRAWDPRSRRLWTPRCWIRSSFTTETWIWSAIFWETRDLSIVWDINWKTNTKPGKWTDGSGVESNDTKALLSLQWEAPDIPYRWTDPMPVSPFLKN